MPIVVSGNTYLNGDAALAGFSQAASDQVSSADIRLLPPAPPSYAYGGTLYGDVQLLSGHAMGGEDVMSGGPEGVSFVGDAALISDFAKGGDDVLTFFAFSGSIIGDADTIRGHGAGGDDIIKVGGRGSSAYGDARALTEFAHGGNDDITATGRFTTAYGDAQTLTDHAWGGDDTLRGGGSTTANQIGDGELSGHAHGGNDVLYASPAASVVLVGDGRLRDHAVAGDDVLVAAPGIGFFTMWGDGEVVGRHVVTGHDRFVFHPGDARAAIMDFEHARDVIDLTALSAVGVHGFEDLALSPAPSPYGVSSTQVTATGLVILVHTDAPLGANDFLFA